MPILLTLLVSCTFVLSGVDAGTNELQVVDDSNLLNKMVNGMIRLEREGKATSIHVLIKQLAREKCDFRLPESSEAPKDLTGPEIYRDWKDSVFILGTLRRDDSGWGYECRSMGFVVSNTGIMLTCYHAVDKPDRHSLFAMNSTGSLYAVRRVVAADKLKDVAVLQVDGEGFRPFRLADNTSVGTRVYVHRSSIPIRLPVRRSRS